ncbi:MAG: monovalent cation/H+ antiporter complex subunit F [Pseudomonadota bacterium]
MTLLTLSAEIASGVVLLAAALCFVRLILGPGTADRAVVLDMLGLLMAAFAGLRAIASNQDAFLDVAAAMALVGFIATLAFARFIARRGPKSETPEAEDGSA